MVDKITNPPSQKDLIDKVNELVDDKQDTLVSGTNIKTINNTSILGSGNISISTGGTATDVKINGTSITSNNEADIKTNGTYNATSNKIATMSDIPTNVSSFTNDSGYITSSALTPYATQNWVENKGYLTEIPAEYVTDSELTAKGYQTAADVETAITTKGYTTMSAVEAKGYITNSALAGYATESYVTTAVGTETTARQNADNNLQSQIDAITASSDVTDIVGTYAELQNYDTSALAPNSIIKVLQDESRNNETTYYRWVITGGVGSWSLIGEEGPYYTIAAADAKFATQTALSTGLSGKQDTISDLATIRSGAALGATAVQSSDLATVATSGSYNDLSNKPTIPAAQVNSDWNATSGVARILNKPTIPTVNNPTITFTQGGTTKGTITLNQLGDQTIAFDAGGGARNIGQIIQSTIPLTDAGLHLLDGSVIQGNGVYSDFVTYIAGLVSTYPDLFETEVNWQTSVTNYGVCGKFVYDSVNNTVRLPKITGFIEGTTDVTALGDLVEAGLPNITGAIDGSSQSTAIEVLGETPSGISITGAFSGIFGNQSALGDAGHDYSQLRGFSFNASHSSSIYGNSSTVQPQTIKAFYYIVIATSTKTEIQVDIDNIATDLNGKANIDFTNCNYIPMRSDVVHIVETYVNGTSWYRVYSDGWCEQGGRVSLNEVSTTVVTYLKPFSNTNYGLQAIQTTQSTASDTEVGIQFTPTSATQGTISCHYINPNTTDVSWYACGYIN